MTQWKSDWIWNDSEESPRNEWWCFRKVFVPRGDSWKQAVLSITADSRYVLYINGQRVGRGPARSWPEQQSYDVHDVGHYLRKGKPNVIAVLVMHYGVSTFYYLRGRGGLLAQLDFMRNGVVLDTLCTDSTWKTGRYLCQDSRAQRMACQQAFAERIDRSAWNEDWTADDYNDSQWKSACVIGPVGMQPWRTLVARDIPFLTEEPLYPGRVVSMSTVKPVRFAVTVDIRSQMEPSSRDHANMVAFTGYIGTYIKLAETAEVTFGFPNTSSVFGPCFIADRWYQPEELCGKVPQKYIGVRLYPGEYLFLMDVTGVDHGRDFHMVIDCEKNIDTAPFFTLGPFDRKVYIDHMPGSGINLNGKEYLRVRELELPGGLDEMRKWIRPVDERLVSYNGVVSRCSFLKKQQKKVVPYGINHLVSANSIPAVIACNPEGDTELIIDFGREAAGYISFEVEAPAGIILDFYGFEYMKGDYIQHTLDLENTLRYVCSEGHQKYESPVYRGLRYLMLTIRNTSGEVKLYQVKLIESTYPLPQIGEFKCSHPLLEDIWEISRQTTRLCMEDTFVDCPAYEQVYWVGDSRNEALVSYYLFGARDIVKRCLQLVPPSGERTPLYYNQVPSGWSSVIPDWTFFWCFACLDYYNWSGDFEFITHMAPAIDKTLRHYCGKIDQEHKLLNIQGWNMLDWAPMDQPNSGIVTHQNMFLAKALSTMARVYHITGNEKAALQYESMRENLVDAINRHLWSETEKAYIDCIHADGRRSDIISMQTQVVAVLCNIAPVERLEVIKQYLIDPPQRFVQICSAFMSFFYYEVLMQIGQEKLMLQDMLKNYGDMLSAGATTCWETYAASPLNKTDPDMLTRSHCHAWSAAPGYFLGAYVLGVKGTSPGWKDVTVKPHSCGLQWAKGRVPVPGGGFLEVQWEIKANNRMKIQVGNYCHSTVTIEMPEGYEGDCEVLSFG